MPDDAKALYDILSTPENLPFSSVPPDISPDVMRARIERWGPETASGKKAILMITLREAGELIGYGGFNCFETAEGQPCDVALQNIRGERAGTDGSSVGESQITPHLTDFGIVLDHRQWGKGYGREVLCGQVEFAIEDIGCSIVRIETDLDNEPWRAVMASVGLGRLEAKQPVTHGGRDIGWVYKIDPETWSEVRDDLKRRGKWPL
ncbi:acetyltransferase [Colletotrichum tofieldiae]|nr:acetyltransferase [Colletotrichum tofieldiae]